MRFRLMGAGLPGIHMEMPLTRSPLSPSQLFFRSRAQGLKVYPRLEGFIMRGCGLKV